MDVLSRASSALLSLGAYSDLSRLLSSVVNSSATCTASQSPDYSSLFNLRRQDPCSIANELLKSCDGQSLICCTHVMQLCAVLTYEAVPVPQSNLSSIPGPISPALHNNPCACSTVFYSLFYVCVSCANATELEMISLDVYQNVTHCEKLAYQAYPHPISPDTAIPAWAYLPLADNGTVDLGQARRVARQSEPDATTPGSYVPEKSTLSDHSTANPTSDQLEAPTGPGSGPFKALPSPTLRSSANSFVSAYRSDADTSSPILTSRITASATAQPSTIATAPTYGSLSSSATTASGSWPASGTSSQGHTRQHNRLAPTVGGALGGLAVVAFGVLVTLCLIRRRRQRLRDAAISARGPLDWLGRSDVDGGSPAAASGYEASDSSTITASDLDSLETLEGVDVDTEKKSVTYGVYPDC